MGNETLYKSLEQLDALADDLIKSRENDDTTGKSEDRSTEQPKDEENTKGDNAIDDPAQEPDSLNDQAKHTLESSPTAKTESGEAVETHKRDNSDEDPNTTEDDPNDSEDNVEKATSPSKIAKEDEEDEDENNNETQNNKKLMNKNEKKARGTDKSGQEKGENDEDDEEDEEELENAKKSVTLNVFGNLSKSFTPGSPEEDFVDAIQKSLYHNEKSVDETRDVLERVAESMVKSMAAVIRTNRHLESENMSLVDVVKSQKDMVDKLVSHQGNFEKSLNTKVEDYGKEPLRRKSTPNVMEKSFEHSAGLSSSEGTLNKSEVLDRLTQMAIQQENGVTIRDVQNYEGNGELRPELERMFKN